MHEQTCRSAELGPSLSLHWLEGEPKLLLRGKSAVFREGASGWLGNDLPGPLSSSPGAASVLWLAPDGWLVVGEVPNPAPLAQFLADIHGDAIDVADEYARFLIAGSHGDPLLKSCAALDLSISEMDVGQVFRTQVAGIHAISRRLASDRIELFVDRSLAHALWDALAAQGREFV